jgi:hypothetical protein
MTRRRAILAFLVIDAAYRWAGPRAAIRRSLGVEAH